MKSKRSRLLALCGIGLLLTLAALDYIRFYISRPVGSGPAGPVVARESFDKPWSDRQVLLLGIGDSVTAGDGAKNANHSYFQRLVANPADEFAELQGLCLSRVLPNLKTMNLAISGSTSITHAEVVLARLEMQSADVYGIVVMTTGGNDLIHSYGRAHYWFYDNVEDPNDRGYDAMRRIFINSIIAHSALHPTRTAAG